MGKTRPVCATTREFFIFTHRILCCHGHKTHTHKANFVEIVVRVICVSYIRHSSKPHLKKTKVLNQNVSLWNLKTSPKPTNRQNTFYPSGVHVGWFTIQMLITPSTVHEWQGKPCMCHFGGKTDEQLQWVSKWIKWIDSKTKCQCCFFTSFYEGRHALCSVLSHILKHIFFPGGHMQHSACCWVPNKSFLKHTLYRSNLLDLLFPIPLPVIYRALMMNRVDWSGLLLCE